MEALIASHSACDLTFQPGDHSVATGTQYKADPVLETGQVSALSKSETSSAMVSALPLLLLAVRQPHVPDFILFIAVFYFLCHFSLTLDGLTIGEDV